MSSVCKSFPVSHSARTKAWQSAVGPGNDRAHQQIARFDFAPDVMGIVTMMSTRSRARRPLRC
jgi:hypothetical protein